MNHGSMALFALFCLAAISGSQTERKFINSSIETVKKGMIRFAFRLKRQTALVQKCRKVCRSFERFTVWMTQKQMVAIFVLFCHMNHGRIVV